MMREEGRPIGQFKGKLMVLFSVDDPYAWAAYAVDYDRKRCGRSRGPLRRGSLPDVLLRTHSARPGHAATVGDRLGRGRGARPWPTWVAWVEQGVQPPPRDEI